MTFPTRISRIVAPASNACSAVTVLMRSDRVANAIAIAFFEAKPIISRVFKRITVGL